MAEYPPPTEDLPIFDNNVFVKLDSYVTVDHINNNFLKYPLAQGAETLTDVTVLGTTTANGTIVQNNTGININQTDHTNNTNANNLRSTSIYGDLNLYRPSGAQGGQIQLRDITTTPAGNNYTQLYESGPVFSIFNQSLGGNISLRQRNALNTQLREVIRATTTGTSINSSQTDGTNPTLTTTEIDSGKSIMLFPNPTSGLYNGAALNGYNQIVSVQTNPNTTVLVVGCHSATYNGLRVNSIANTTEIGQGNGGGGVYATSFSCDGTTSTITGPASFTSLTPPISSQTIPASTDSSNKIPTTAWVQSAIGSGGGGSIPLFLRGYKIASGVVSSPMASVFVNFNGSAVTVNDNFTLRFSIRYDYNTDIVGQSLYYNSYYGNLVVFPNRVITNNSVILLSGSINGNTTYTYNDATYAPSGRYIWTENYSNTQLTNPLNYTVNPVVLTTTNLTQLKFSFVTPYTAGASSICALSVSLELINSSTSTLTISSTTSGFTTINKNF